jgi:hypothetical protein
MTEILPLLETSESARARELLKAGRADAAPDNFSNRLLVGLGVAGVVSGVTVTASAGVAGAAVQGAASTGSGAASLGVLVAKWVAVGVLGGGILAGGAELTMSPPAPAKVVSADAPRSTASPVSKKRAAVQPSRPVMAEAVEPAPSAAPLPVEAKPAVMPSTASPSTVSVEQGQLGREVQAIDRARRARAAGDRMRALTELDAFEQLTRTGALDREAQVLRIETLYEMGQQSRARELASKYLGAFPNDAHTARLRALIEQGETK